MTEIKHYDMKPSPCPACDALPDVATSMSEERSPRPGDLSVCFHCGELLEFDYKLAVIRLRPEIFGALDIRTVATLQLAQNIARNRRTLEA